MLRYLHVLPLGLLLSVPAFAMEKSEVVKAEPAKELSWQKQHGNWVANEGAEASKPVAKEECPNALLTTIVAQQQYPKQQAELASLEAQEKALKEAKAKKLAELQASLTDLHRRVSGKQAAEVGANCAIENIEKQIKTLHTDIEKITKEKEAFAKETADLQATIKATSADVAKAQAEAAPKKKGWGLW